MLATCVQGDMTWTFERLPDGSVRISKFEMMDGLGMGEHITLPDLLWCALTAVLAPSGPTSSALVSALMLNNQKTLVMKDVREAVARVTDSPENVKLKKREERLRSLSRSSTDNGLDEDDDTDEQDVADEPAEPAEPTEPEIVQASD
jgi:hypothetical protein